jgi:hypothetical protein
MASEYRKLTDYIQTNLGDIDYAIFGKRIGRIFNYDFIKICVDKFPKDKLPHMSPIQKSKYLLGICKAEAGSADYTKRNNRKLFNESDFDA